MYITKKSVISGLITTYDIPMNLEQYKRYTEGELIQSVCPHLSPKQREFLITGMSYEEQDEFYGKVEEWEREDEEKDGYEEEEIEIAFILLERQHLKDSFNIIENSFFNFICNN